MFSLKKDIINLDWESPQDEIIEKEFIGDNVLKNYLGNISKLSPYNSNYDSIFDLLNKELKNKNFDLSKENIGEAYKKLHFFINIQANIWEISVIYKNNLERLDYSIEALESLLKIMFEDEAKKKIAVLFKEKENKLEEIRMKNFTEKEKFSSVETRFISTSLSNEDKKLEAKLSFLTGQKLNNLIYNKVKAHPFLNELKRKRTILKTAVEYTDKLFKIIQEQINGYKKIIDNLVFLYNSYGWK